jgi:hypothetical protein
MASAPFVGGEDDNGVVQLTHILQLLICSKVGLMRPLVAAF